MKSGARLWGVAAFCAVALCWNSRAAAATPSEDFASPVPIGDVAASVDSDGAESPLGRLEAQKVAIGGEVTAEVRDLVLAEAARIRSKQAATVGGAWAPLGPTNITRFQNGVNKARDNSGRMRTILPDPRRADTVYLLTSGGGLWKTTNFGASQPKWTARSDGIYGTAGGAAAFGRSPDVIYLGTGDPFDLGVGGIVYKSTDGADSWSAPVVLPGAASVHDIRVDTSAGSTTADDIVLVATDVGLYRSTDGGATFSYVTVDPTGFEVVWAASTGGGHEDWSLARTSAGWLVSQVYWATCTNCQEFNVAYLSTDQGATWNYIPDPGPIGGDFSAGRVTLTAAGPGNSIVYALAANTDGSDQLDIFRSADGGLTFSALGTDAAVPTNPNIFNPDVDLMHGQAWYNQMILADPGDPSGNTVYAGGNFSSAVSRDGGATWTLLTSWLGNISGGGGVNNGGGSGTQFSLPYAHADFHAAAVSTAGRNPRLFFGNDGGIFYSDDGGKSFIDNANQGLQTALIYTLSVGPVHPDNTLLGVQDNGTLFRVNGGTYTGSIGGDGFGTAWSQANDDISMGSLYFLDIRRWKSNPPNNQAKYDRLRSVSNLAGPAHAWYEDSYFITPLATPTPTADPTGHVFFTNTQHYLLKTADGGDSWSAIWTSPSASRVVRSSSHTIGLAPDSTDHIGLAGNSSRVIVTHDGGANWSIVNMAATLPAWPSFNATVAIAPDHDVMYVGNKFTGNAPHVARSADGGNTWVDATGDLPKLPVNKLVVDPDDATGNTVYAANWIGVYRTADGGATWARVGTGLPLAMVSDLYLEPHGKFLRIASYGRGVWQLPLPLN